MTQGGFHSFLPWVLSLVGVYHAFRGLPGLGSTASLLQTISLLGFDNLTTHMPSPVVPKGVIARCLPERSKLVAFGSSGMSFLPGYLQPQQLPEGSVSPQVCCICVPVSRWIRGHSGRTNRNVFLAMFPSVVTECTSRALTFCLAFINFFLVNSLVCRLPYLVYDLFPGRCCFLFDLSRRLFCSLEYPFLFSGILWFLSRRRCLFGAYLFWATVPKEFPLSFRRSWRSSSSLTALWRASNHSLSSMYSCCMDIRLIASSGTSSSTIFLKAIPVTFARLCHKSD